MPAPSTRPCSAGLAVLLAACAHAPKTVTPPSPERIIAAPAPLEAPIDPALLTHLLRGLYFLASGHPGAAVPHLRLALIYDEKSPFIHEQLCLAWAASGDLERGRAVLEAGLKLAPEDAHLNRLAGELALSERHFSAAAEHLSRAVTDPAMVPGAGPMLTDALLWTNPSEAVPTAASLAQGGDAALLLGLAAAFEDHGLLNEALSYYRRARTLSPSNEGAALSEARVLILLGSYGEAADALTPLFSLYPDDVQLHLEIYRWLWRAGDTAALAYRQEAERQAAGELEPMLHIAAADLRAGRVGEGRALLQKLVATHPEQADARLLLANTLLVHGEAAACVALLQDAPPAGWSQHAQRARCLAAAGKVDASLVESEAAMRSGAYPRDELLAEALALAQGLPPEKAHSAVAELTGRIGGLLDSQARALAEVVLLDYDGRGSDALRIVEELLTENPDDADLRMRHADLLARYSDPKQAIAELQQLLDDAPDDATRLNALGFTLTDAGLRLDEAEVWIRRANRLAPDQGFILDSLAWLLFHRDKPQAALPLLEEAERAAPQDAEILRHLGDVQQALGRAQQARDAWQKAISAHPPRPLQELLRERLSRSGA